MAIEAKEARIEAVGEAEEASKVSLSRLLSPGDQGITQCPPKVAVTAIIDMEIKLSTV